MYKIICNCYHEIDIVRLCIKKYFPDLYKIASLKRQTNKVIQNDMINEMLNV